MVLIPTRRRTVLLAYGGSVLLEEGKELVDGVLDVLILFLRVDDDGLVELLDLILGFLFLLDLRSSFSGLKLLTFAISSVDWDSSLRLLRLVCFLDNGLLSDLAILGLEVLLFRGVGFILWLSFGHLYKERFS